MTPVLSERFRTFLLLQPGGRRTLFGLLAFHVFSLDDDVSATMQHDLQQLENDSPKTVLIDGLVPRRGLP